MKTRAIDPAGDWTFGQGTANYKDGLAALEQDLKTRILSWKGDCFFADDDFIDWNNIIGSRGMEAELRQQVSSLILKTYGVIGITSFGTYLDSNSRRITLDISLNTIYGNLQITEQI